MQENPLQRIESATQASPKRHPIGAFSGDLGGGAGAGVMMFHWHSTPTELLDALLFTEPHIREMDVMETHEFLSRAAALRRAGDSLTPELLSSLNELLHPYDSNIGWWGQYDDLQRGADPFARDLREQFWTHLSVEKGDQPIDQNHGDAFIAYLRDYGF